MKSLITIITILFLVTPSLATDISETDVKIFLDNWLTSQNKGSFTDYSYMYSTHFVGVRRSGTKAHNLNHDAWLKDRKKMFNKKMIVKANNPEFTLSGTSASVKFEQIWESSSYKDKGDKLLELTLENGKIKITREEMLFSKVENIFTSVYTDLKKDCKDKFSDVGEGQDMPVICKGPKNYMIDVEFSACCEHMEVYGSEDFLLLFPEQIFVTVMKRKLEWRLANGKPFAVIFLIDKYKGDITLSPEKAGEVYLVKGLDGFHNIDHEVDNKLHSNPNLEARRLADQGYLHQKLKIK